MTPILGIWASQISGHLWAPAGAYDALATVTVPSGGAATVDFVGIPTGYKHLQIRGIARTTQAVSEPALYYRFNGDAGSNYSVHRLGGNGSSAYAQSSTSTTVIGNYGPAGANLASNIFGTNIFDVLDYANTNKNKTARLLTGLDYNGGGNVALCSGAWYNTSAITSISIFSDANFTQFTTFALYGVK